jgi:hypothetical protein
MLEIGVLTVILNNNLPEEKVVAGTCTLEDLLSFEGGYTLEIPDYQRPYVWKEKQTDKLLRDLNDFTPAGMHPEEHITAASTHYLGSILLYKGADGYEIIDGQQRVTTLLLLDAAINGDDCLIRSKKKELKLYYDAPVSKTNIAGNYRYLQANYQRFLHPDRRVTLFRHLTLTVIITNSQDDAFNFFVSQNNRGLMLGAVDLLKSYHLRELRKMTAEQRVFARNWDRNNEGQFLTQLFSRVLWRGRRWRGKSVAYDGPDDIQREFEEMSVSGGAVRQVRFYPSRSHHFSGSLSVSEAGDVAFEAPPLVTGSSAAGYPFSFRQPIEKGSGFFLYTEKYAAIHRHLFHGHHIKGSGLFRARDFYQEVYQNGGMSDYLKSLYKLCLILYYDQFGEEGIFSFVLWLDYLLGSYRVNQKSIVSQTPVRICRDQPDNLLDVITSSYRPEEVCDFLIQATSHQFYRTTLTGEESGVRSDYIRHLKSYFNKEATAELDQKKDWIHARINIE